MRNCTLTAQMPVDSSSIIQSSTNGVEPPMQPLVYKSAKNGRIPVLIPHINKWKNRYSYAFTFDNIHLIELYALMQKFIDMSISTNHYYDFSKYPDNKLPDSVVIRDILNSFKYGLNSLYYAKTKGITDDTTENPLEIEENSGCAGGSCTL